MEPFKLNLTFVDTDSLKYVIKKDHFVILNPSCFKYKAEYTLEIENNLKGKIEEYHNLTYSCKRSSIIGVESDYSDSIEAWTCDLIISGASGFRILFKTAKEAEDFKTRIEQYIYTEIFEMKPLLS